MERDWLSNSLILTPVVALMAIAGLYLWKDLKGHPSTTTAVVDEREPIGTLLIANNSVKRKTSEDSYWVDITANTPVYDKDSIRTGALSASQIQLNDSSVLDISENSLIVLEKNSDRLLVDLKLGDLSAKGKSSAFAIKIDNQTVQANNAQVDFKLDAQKKAQISVKEGKAVLNDGKKFFEIDKQKLVRVDEKGKTETIAVGVTLKAPANRSTFMSPEATTEIPFSWDVISDKTGEQIFEIATSSDFAKTKTITKTASGLTQGVLHRGKNYWRVGWKTPEGVKYSEIWSVTLQPDVRLKLTAPQNQTAFDFAPNENQIELSWETAVAAPTYVIDLADVPDFLRLRKSEKVAQSPFILKDMAPGTYYWRVRALAHDNTEIARSNAFNFSIKTTLPQIPELKAPQNMYRWTLNEPLLLEWKKDSIATQYRLTIARSASLKDVIKNQTQPETTYLWKWTQPGHYYWGIEALDAKGALVGESLRYKFEIAPPKSGLGITLLSPKDQSLVQRERRTPVDPVPLEWKPDRDLTGGYTLHVATHPDLKNAKIVKDIQTLRYSYRFEESGLYYWKVIWTNPTNKDEFLESPIYSVRIKVFSQLLAPQLTTPLADEKILSLAKEPVHLVWEPVDGAAHYRVVVERYNPKTKETVPTIDKTVDLNEYTTDPLDRGIYRWSVTALDKSQTEGISSLKRTLLIDARRELAAPKLKAPVMK